ncbi:peptidyl-tRNA hydrolase 2, mitochondrial isoform X2 [Ctenocephalides felis]|uniref:peptidyl-tRNA hydrolase 2, mitochondrial isoform X2 n=1 Tax=Ctenocephalides felis TaxID=7515 RepID=UPI000E6E4635|nr:peptidyl-tRNA hydrolase 2, mitochondrial isoform X2 [Ctenocephalides felis]
MVLMLDSSFVTGLSVGLAIGYLCTLIQKKLSISRIDGENTITEPADVVDMDSDGEYKMVLVVRTDLKMGKGKVASQCAHAAVGAYQQCRRKDPKSLRIWEASGQAKIAVKIDTEESMLEVLQKAKGFGLITSLVRDAGRTQISPNTKTVLAVGPGPKSVIDHITGDLKLL